MSQVIRKYNSGGKSPEEPELFEWKDVGKYNKSDLISGLYRNVDTYITNNNLSGKKADAFRTATSRLIDGIKNGTVTLNGDGTFNVSDKSLSSTGQFDKNFLGGEKNTDNNANNRAGDYVLDYIKSMNTYKKPTVATPKKEKFDFNKYFTGEVSRRWYGGNDIDNDNFFNRRSEEDRLKLMADIASGITPEMLSGYDLEGTIGADEILNRSKRFVEAINNGTLDNNDYNAFAELGGGGLDRWLKPQEEQTATVDVRGNLRKQWEAEARQKGYTDEAIQAYIDNKQRALDEASQKEVDARNTAQEEKLHADAKAAEEERIKQLGAFNIGNYNTISTLPEVTPYNFEDVYKSRYDNPWSLSFSAYDLNPDKSTQTVPLHREDGSGYYDSVNIGKTVPGTTAAQRLANDLDYYIRAADLRAQKEGNDSYRLEQLGSGEYVIPDSYNPSTGLIRVYNPKTRQLRWVEALTTQTGKDRVEYLYNMANSPKYKAEGGILKAQQGNVIDWNALNKRANEEMYERNRQADQRYFKSIEETKAKESGKSEEQATNDSKPHTQWSKADITRMGALAGDVASLLASFTGVGSVASAGIGAASTAANQAADMMEGQSFGQALWNNAGSYVLDAISLIPFAKAAKVPRMIKNVGRFAPLMTTSLATYQGLSNGREYLDSWNKAKNGESLTVGDWRNILSSLQLVLGGTAATHRASKAKSHVEAAVTGDEWVKTNQGYRRVSADKMKAIRKAKTLEEQNKILEGTGIVLPEAKTWTGKGKGVAKIPDTDKANMVYDFSKPVTTYSGDLPLQHKFGPGERWLGTAQFPDFHLPGVRDAYNRIIHPQAYKRARGKNQSVAKSSELLALPAPNQVTPGVRGSFGYNATTGRHTTDVTDPNKLAQAKATGDRRNEIIRSERLTQQAEAREAQKAKNEALVAWAVNQPFPKQPLAGAARISKEKSYRNIFQPVTEREYNKVWDEAVKNRKDFGYEDVTPRRNIYTAPTPTEITPNFSSITDKNARYLWELVNPPKRSTAHIKRELPKKQTKPKTKKKSKDDRVTKKADGGLLIPKFQSPAAPIQRRNVRSADDLSWNNDILNSLGLKNTLGNITPANASKYNNMQGDYAKLGFGTSKPGDISLTYDPNAAAYQTTFNNLTSVNQDAMSDLVRRGRITGRGGSSDKGTQWTADGLKGDQTFLRHLGTAATTKEGMDVLKSLVPDDIDVIKNLNQGMVNFMPKLKMAGITDGKGFNIPNTPIATTGLLDETVPDVEATPQDIKTTNNSGSYKLNTKGKAAINTLSGLRTLPEDIIALGRMVGGLRANRRAADKYKEGLKPLLVDTYENVVPITGNYLAKVSADKQASNLTSLAARPRTSDGSLQLAGELEAGNRAAQMRFQGDMADANMFNITRTLAQQESDAAKARRTEVANRNRASMLQINAAKKQIDSARITNNYERVISPYLGGIEGRFRQNRAASKQFDLEQARLASATKYKPQLQALQALQALQDRYLEAQKNKDQEGMKAAMNDYYRLVDAQNQEMLAQRKKLTQMPWLFEQVNPVQAKIPYNKSGAKMNSADKIIMQRASDFNKRMLEDNKQLHKNINESKKQQADLIKHMSSLTAELIKKGMSWK